MRRKLGMSTESALCRIKLVLDHTVNVQIGKQWIIPQNLQGPRYSPHLDVASLGSAPFNWKLHV